MTRHILRSFCAIEKVPKPKRKAEENRGPKFDQRGVGKRLLLLLFFPFPFQLLLFSVFPLLPPAGYFLPLRGKGKGDENAIFKYCWEWLFKAAPPPPPPPSPGGGSLILQCVGPFFCSGGGGGGEKKDILAGGSFPSLAGSPPPREGGEGMFAFKASFSPPP